MKKSYARHNKSEVLLKATNSTPTNLATPFTVKRVKWEIHNHDADINEPSCPHMHAIGKPWKLNLYTGDIYDINTGKIVGRVKRKELLAIWKSSGVYRIILTERAIYEELHKSNPKRYPTLPPLLITSPNHKRDASNVFRMSHITGKTAQNKISIVVQFTNKLSHNKSNRSYSVRNQIVRKYSGRRSTPLYSSHLASSLSQKS